MKVNNVSSVDKLSDFIIATYWAKERKSAREKNFYFNRFLFFFSDLIV